MRNSTTVDEVRAAVRWALSHDLTALLAYRQVTHLDKAGRRQADAALVAHWQQATGAGFRPVQIQERQNAAPLPRRH